MSGVLPLGSGDGSSDLGSMTILLGGVAVALAGLWLRMRFYRNRFNRAVKAMNRGGLAQRAATAFWRIVALCVLVEMVRLYAEAHAR